MEDPRPGLDPPVDLVRVRRWWLGPRVGTWPDAVQMAVPVAAAALLTVCGVGLALLLNSHGGGWKAPVVFGLGTLTVLFYGWAIYSAVHPLPSIRSRMPQDVEDTTDPAGPAG
jgi:hypothetical protein